MLEKEFFDAIAANDIGRVRACFAQKGFNINCMNPQGEDGLTVAIKLGHDEIAELLIASNELEVSHAVDSSIA